MVKIYKYRFGGQMKYIYIGLALFVVSFVLAITITNFMERDLPSLAKLHDIQHRERLSWASTIACSQFAGLGGGSGFMTMHGIEHALSGAYDIAHGDGLAALLVAWMKHTYTARQNRFKALALNVFGKADAIKATEDWLKQVGMNLKLKDLGVNESDFASLAENALRTAMWVKFHPAPMDEQSIAGIYRACY